MSSLIIGLMVFGCVLGGALLGIFLRTRCTRRMRDRSRISSVPLRAALAQLGQ